MLTQVMAVALAPYNITVNAVLPGTIETDINRDILAEPGATEAIVEATYETPSGRLVVFGHYEANGNPAMAQPGYCELRGTQGTAYLSDTSIRVIPEKGGQFQDHKPRMEPQMLNASNQATVRGNANLSLTAQHARNFLDSIKSRAKPKAPGSVRLYVDGKPAGIDAVVLSTRPHPRGVELLASPYGELAVPAVGETAEAGGSSRILAELARLQADDFVILPRIQVHGAFTG